MKIKMVFPISRILESVSVKEFLEGSLRILRSGVVFSGKLGRVAWEIINGNPPLTTVAVRLREAFEELGATYIKLGQFIASAPSLFPPELVDEMQKCLDQVRPVPIRDIHKIIQKELGAPVHSIFHSFENQPLASASIAQVHGAITKEGLDVVVKIQRPDIGQILETDMAMIRLLVSILERIAPGFRSSGLANMVEEFRKSILKETDFILEAANIEEFENCLLRLGEGRAAVPRVYHAYSTRKILTMERFYGSPITNERELKKYTSNPREVIEAALEVWFSTLAECGFFHADVHAGNLIILRDGRIGFIDFGIVGRIQPKTWSGLMLFMQGIGIGNAEMVAEGLILMDSMAENINRQKLIQDLNRVFQQLFQIIRDLEAGEIDAYDTRINKVMFDTKEIAESNGLRIPGEFGLLFKQILYFDRYVKALAPDIDLLRDQRRYIPR